MHTRGDKLRVKVLIVLLVLLGTLKMKTWLFEEYSGPTPPRWQAIGVSLPQKPLERDLCKSIAQKRIRHSGRVFYTSYQSSVLNGRKPFAIDKGFFNIVEQYYSNKKIWLDAGAGTCDTMKEIEKNGHEVFGVELSDVCITRCNNYARSGQVLSAGLDEIPFPSNSFDLVWSTEVLEHVPTHLINQSVAEIVRVARRDIFLTIAMKRSGFDPPPPEKPRIHLSVLPRSFWDAIFKTHGCKVNEELREKLKSRMFRKATFFPFICDELIESNPGCTEKVSAYLLCYTRENGNKDKCSFAQMEIISVCFPM